MPRLPFWPESCAPCRWGTVADPLLPWFVFDLAKCNGHFVFRYVPGHSEFPHAGNLIEFPVICKAAHLKTIDKTSTAGCPECPGQPGSQPWESTWPPRLYPHRRCRSADKFRRCPSSAIGFGSRFRPIAGSPILVTTDSTSPKSDL